MAGRTGHDHGRGAILEASHLLLPYGIHLFFKHGAHFRNPLVPAEWEALAQEPALEDPVVRRVVLELLPARLPGLARGIYSPVPIARALGSGRDVDALLDDFRYEMIRVDDDQRWSWCGRPVAPRTKSFFLEHLAWEPAISVWYFEYRVNADWWDKSYLDAAVTPLRAVAVEEDDGALVATLDNGSRDRLDLATLRLDGRERLFCRSARSGEVMFSDAVRFALLGGINEACDAVRIAGAWRPLHWP